MGCWVQALCLVHSLPHRLCQFWPSPQGVCRHLTHDLSQTELIFPPRKIPTPPHVLHPLVCSGTWQAPLSCSAPHPVSVGPVPAAGSYSALSCPLSSVPVPSIQLYTADSFPLPPKLPLAQVQPSGPPLFLTPNSFSLRAFAHALLLPGHLPSDCHGASSFHCFVDISSLEGLPSPLWVKPSPPPPGNSFPSWSSACASGYFPAPVLRCDCRTPVQSGVQEMSGSDHRLARRFSHISTRSFRTPSPRLPPFGAVHPAQAVRSICTGL